jgi:uncharacterized coiled-coil protein SlyX
MNLHQQIGAIFDRAAKPQETVIERASRVMAENQREIERLTHELEQAKIECAKFHGQFAVARDALPDALRGPFEFDIEERAECRDEPYPHPAEYATYLASQDIVLDCVNALLEKHDDELVEMVREAQLKAWGR